jgi:hypothetical protein
MNYILSYTLKHRTLADTFEEHYIIYAQDEFQDSLSACLSACNEHYEKLVSEEGETFVDWYLYHAIISISIKSTDLY